MKKTVAFCTLGCKVNQYETDAMRGSFEAEGYEVKEFSQEASVYVINTCTVTNMAKKKNPDGIIVAVGCYVQAAKEQLEEDTLIDLVIGNNMKSQVVQIVEQYIQDNRHTEDRDAYVADIAHSHEYEAMHIETVSEHTRAYIKIQDGCNQFCSYCIIPYARGRVRSRKMEDILQEVRNLTANGYKEIVLTGIHISSYGLDFEHTADEQEDYGPFKNSALIDLIEALSGIEGLERIRLGSLEPRIITENFVRRLCKVPQICPHFHLSLQSGCDTVLSRMNRRYDTAEYEAGCALLRRYFEHPAITTDVIVGFPGETDEEFETTERYLERIHFYEMQIFQNSRRQGTKAAAMPDQVPEAVKKERSEKLLALGHRMSEEFRRYYLGRQVTALLEEEFLYDGKRYYTGYTKEYVKVAVETEKDLSNTFVTGTLKTQLTEDIYLLVEF